MKVATRITVATAVVVALASAAYAYFDLSRVRSERAEQLEGEARAVANTLRLVTETRTPSEAQLKTLAWNTGWTVHVFPRAKADDFAFRDPERGWLRVMLDDPS